jgi:SAM-dependent methyltransferase
MDSTRRFSNRVADYVRYRPTYPPAVISDLVSAAILTAGSVVADIGSGTGLLARLFLENGNRVFGVEPNPEMRGAGEHELAGYRLFMSVAGTAEATTLPHASVDLVAAGQAFHWFDRQRARDEFRRILRPPGWVTLVWNDRKTDSSAFLADYEHLLQTYATDYTAVDHRRMTDEVIGEFFHPNPFTLRTCENRQVFDYQGLRGRLLSSSYAPPPGHPRHDSMIEALAAIFQAHERENRIALEYETKVYTGSIL